MAAFDVLRRYLEDRAEFTEAELALVKSVFVPRTMRAGEFLQRAGDVTRYTAFVASGCLRSYVIDAKGKEHIVTFAPETWWIGDNKSALSGTPSTMFIEAIEDSELLLLDVPSHETLIERVPGYADAFRRGVVKHAAAKDQRIVSSLTASAEERYLDFVKTYPSIASRVPQWMVASYLGLTPETISRVRKNLSRR
jgi:CRP-like cAMP-binding protein